MNKVTKVADNGEVYVAVLVSTEYGAGWSTWNDHPQMLFDPIVVNYLDPKFSVAYDKEKYNSIDMYLRYTYDEGYFGGLSDLVIEWVQQGVEFMIDEHDGLETLIPKNYINFITA